MEFISEEIDMELSELKAYYNTNEDFKRYVDKCMETYNWTLEYALLSPITISYYKYITSC